MNRRAFLASLVAVAVAPPVALVPGSTAGLALHPDAFAIAMRPLTLDEQFSCEFDWESWSKAMAQADGRRS